MLLVEIGRQVFMRNIQKRNHMAVITGIIDSKFVVIHKQDRQNEVIRVDDIVLGQRLFDINNLESENFYKISKEKELSDFDRYKLNLKSKIQNELLKEYE